MYRTTSNDVCSLNQYQSSRVNTEEMWTPYKDLQNLIERYITSSSNTLDPQFREFTEKLRDFRQNFLTLLKNPPKNAQHREEILKGDSNGINSPGLGYQLLTKELIDETLIISDMYDLNEFMALDLLLTAQLQMSHHPGLTRGLTAVLLYYDGRKALTSALKTLVQARAGHSWTLDIPIALTKQITEYTNKMQEDGLLDRILYLLEEMDPLKEQELLQQNRALGDAKHHFMVMKLYNDTRQDLADIIYMWSAQSALPSTIMFRLLRLLEKSHPESSQGYPDKITLAIIMAFLNSLNLSSLHTREDGEEIVRSMPLISERGIFEEVIQKLIAPNILWESAGLRGFVQFALAIAVATSKTAPNLGSAQNMTKEDDLLVEAALSNKAFHFAVEVLFKAENLNQEEFYLRYFHILISDFILLMPLKIKELRSRADESMRLIQAYQQEGIEPPVNLDNHFKYLMLMIAELYKDDPLELNLAMDYWCQHSETSHVPNTMQANRLPTRQVALFKFVRLAGEILPAGLFVPYLNMIASLASSPQAARHAFNFLKPNGSTGSTTISWDHFFNSLSRYYYNLRQELPPTQDTVYRPRGHPKGITPNEVKGLEAVLQVVQVVAKYDELSRVALCDHPGWKVLQSLIGLVSCAMPIPLKGILVRTLAALAKSQESSTTIWLNLEAAQIITTIPSTSSYQPRGVQTELEEIESRNEEYPLTRAVIELLDTLTDFPIPKLLGIGQRIPGFDPYLSYIINTVFLRFNTRSYKNPVEKWEVANLCLKILKKLLKQYVPAVEDFIGRKAELHGGETTLTNALPGYHLMTQLHSNTELLRVILYIIDEGCNYFDDYNSFPAKKYLEECTLNCLGILDCCLKNQHNYMSQLALVSNQSNKISTGLSRLLLGVNHRSGKPDHMINIAKYIFYNNWLLQHAYTAIGVIQSVSNEPGADMELLSTFTSTSSLTTNIRHGFVECLDMEDLSNTSNKEEIEKNKQVLNCKEKIILLLMESITRPAPNIAHYFLGFEISKDIRKTIIQQPGILGYPRTCLHSILGILESSLEKGRDKITEACYCFLHTLVSNNKTSTPVLRFLRTATNQDFVQRHLSKLPFQGPNKATELTCMSWLLKIAAIELRVGTGNLQSSLIQRFTGNLGQDRDQVVPSQKLLMELLHHTDFHLSLESPKTWEYFDPSQIEMEFVQCSVPVALSGGPQLIDIKQLHSKISKELYETQTSATLTQRKLMQQELQSILAYAMKRNQIKTLSYATVKFVEGWCQTTEILFSIATNQQLPTAQRQNLLLNLSHDLLQKMTSCEALNEIKQLVSGTVLILLVNLRVSFAIQSDNELLPSSTANTTIMKIILNQILQWILNSEASSQKVRTHLLGALLYFLCVVGNSEKSKGSIEDSTFFGNLDNSLYRTVPVQEHSQRYAIIQVIKSFGDKLIDIICHSCSGGHDVCKMLGLSCLNKIFEIDCSNTWVIYLSSRGHLKYMVDSLLESDNQLRCVLQTDPPSLRPLYLYEAKMAMFIRMATTRHGAESLLENKILSCLSSMCVIDQHLDIHHNFIGNDPSFLPSVNQRYQQIFLPMLYLCDALLTTLGTENQSCAIQICGFLQCHRDVIEMKLRNITPTSNKILINEVACLTGIIARSANIDIYRLVDEELEKTDLKEPMSKDNGLRELRAHLYKLQKLMLIMLSKFQKSVETNKFLCIQIIANVLLYIRNQMRHSHLEAKLRNALLSIDSSNEIHLGTVSEHLISATDLLQKLVQKEPMCAKDMTCAEIKKYLVEEEIEFDIKKQNIIIEQRLNEIEADKRRNIKYVSLIIEHALFILWSHLDFFAMQSMTPKFQLPTNLDDNTFEWRKLNEHMPYLKKELASVFTDHFISKLTSSGISENFNESLIRRIKRLLQFIN